MEGLTVREDATLPTARLAPAGRVKARIREARSGGFLTNWKATIRQVAGARLDSSIASFLSQHPVAGLGSQLDDPSVPTGGFELTVESPGLATRRMLVSPVRALEVLDLGDVFLTTSGSLRVAISFPRELPESELILAVAIPAPAGTRGRPTPIGERRLHPGPSLVADFGSVDPGLLIVSVRTDPPQGLWVEEEVPIYSDQRADVAFVFSPIVVSGDVTRGSSVLREARVALYQAPGQSAETLTDDAGHYSLRVWSWGKYGFRATPSGGQGTVDEDLVIPADSSEIHHDFHLPDAALAGRVSDSSGRAIAGAVVNFQTTADGDGMIKPGSQSGKATSDADGQFAFSGLGPQNVDLDIRARGFAPKLVKGLAPAQDSLIHEIVLESGGGIHGRVLESGGAPMVGALVYLSRSAPALLPEQQATTDGAGEFDFEAVSGDKALLIVHSCGYLLEMRPITISSARDPELVVLLPSSGQLTVRFVDGRDHLTKVGGVSYEVNSSMLPPNVVGKFVSRCGNAGTSAQFSMDFLPRGLVRAFTMNGAFLASFQNEGSPSTWTIHVSRSTPGVLP